MSINPGQIVHLPFSQSMTRPPDSFNLTISGSWIELPPRCIDLMKPSLTMTLALYRGVLPEPSTIVASRNRMSSGCKSIVDDGPKGVVGGGSVHAFTRDFASDVKKNCISSDIRRRWFGGHVVIPVSGKGRPNLSSPRSRWG